MTRSRSRLRFLNRTLRAPLVGGLGSIPPGARQRERRDPVLSADESSGGHGVPPPPPSLQEHGRNQRTSEDASGIGRAVNPLPSRDLAQKSVTIKDLETPPNRVRLPPPPPSLASLGLVVGAVVRRASRAWRSPVSRPRHTSSAAASWTRRRRRQRAAGGAIVVSVSTVNLR
jgi:hypothetical protein